MKALLGQYRSELTLSLRNGEQLLVNLFIPVGILVFFSKVQVFNSQSAKTIDVLAPSVLGLAVMSTALVSLGIGTGFERFYGVLKRLGTTPLGRPRWVAAKFLTVLTIEVGQWAVLIPAALALGWHPANHWPAAIGATLLATFAFGGLGLLLAGTLPGMLNLAVCNGLYLALMVTGDMIINLKEMPQGLQAIARALPAAPLADLMICSLASGAAHHANASSWPVLGAWAVGCPLLAAWRFHWD